MRCRASGHVGELRGLLAEWQQRIAFGAARAAARVFAQEKQHEGEDETKADGQGERYDVHEEESLVLPEGGGAICGLGPPVRWPDDRTAVAMVE